MPIDIKKYNELKAKADQAKTDADQAEGAFKAALAQLKANHGCGTLAEANKLLQEKQSEEAAAMKEYEDALRAFEEEWGELLDGQA